MPWIRACRSDGHGTGRRGYQRRHIFISVKSAEPKARTDAAVVGHANASQAPTTPRRGARTRGPSSILPAAAHGPRRAAAMDGTRTAPE